MPATPVAPQVDPDEASGAVPKTRVRPLARRAATFNLFVAFAFTVMADPVSSVAYALEAALHGLDGRLGSLFPTMALVLGGIALVASSYHDLIGRYPDGGGGAKGIGAAFGEAWAFVPLGALLVDFTLTIAVSCAAGASAAIAYLPGLADARSPLALALVVLVAGAVLLGHRARVVFATATSWSPAPAPARRPPRAGPPWWATSRSCP